MLPDFSPEDGSFLSSLLALGVIRTYGLYQLGGRSGHCSLLSCPFLALEVPLTTSHLLSALRSCQVYRFGNTQTFTWLLVVVSLLRSISTVYLHMSPLGQSGVSDVSNSNGVISRMCGLPEFKELLLVT